MPLRQKTKTTNTILFHFLSSSEFRIHRIPKLKQKKWRENCHEFLLLFIFIKTKQKMNEKMMIKQKEKKRTTKFSHFKIINKSTRWTIHIAIVCA